MASSEDVKTGQDKRWKHFLIVDSDKETAELLGRFLGQYGFIASMASDSGEMFEILKGALAVDLIILDVMLPGLDGFEICRKLRMESAVPLVILTASGEDADCIVCLELGADDYITKPFNPKVLLARVRAILRRSQWVHEYNQQEAKGNATHYKFSGWVLDTATRRLISPDDSEIAISAGEYDLLLTFVERPQRVLSRHQLLDFTRDKPAEPFDRSIDVQISRLRQKIEDNPKKPTLIKTVRGGGYMFTSVVENV